MFAITALSSFLEWLILMPVNFIIMQFFLPPYFALLLAGMLCVLSVLASVLCRAGMKGYIYKIIAFAAAAAIGCASAGVSIGACVVMLLCSVVFMRARSNMKSGKDISIQISILALLLNIPLAIFNKSTALVNFVQYSNAAIFISTIASIVILILRQVDDSRRFGKNDMLISTAQRKNNQVFGGIMIVLLLAISSIGQVSSIYSLVFKVFAAFFRMLAYLFMPKSSAEQQMPNQMQNIFGSEEVKEPSRFAVIIQMIFTVLAVIVIIAFCTYAVNVIVKMLIKLVRRLINWFRNSEQLAVRFTENGHVDEKQSLYNRNLRNMASKLRNAAAGLFDRELPYNKLPDNKAKLRRLFKYFMNNARQEGAMIKDSSTAEEICNGVSDISPEKMQFNNLMSKYYNSVRYGDSSPSPQELQQFEQKLLK